MNNHLRSRRGLLLLLLLRVMGQFEEEQVQVVQVVAQLGAVDAAAAAAARILHAQRSAPVEARVGPSLVEALHPHPVRPLQRLRSEIPP